MNSTAPQPKSIFGDFIVDEVFLGLWDKVSPASRDQRRKSLTYKLPTDRMVDLHRQGMTNREIAAQLGCCHTTVANRLRRKLA